MGKANAGKWISASQAATLLGVTIPTIHNWRKNKVFKRVKARRSPKLKGKKRAPPRYRFWLGEIERLAKTLNAA